MTSDEPTVDARVAAKILSETEAEDAQAGEEDVAHRSTTRDEDGELGDDRSG